MKHHWIRLLLDPSATELAGGGGGTSTQPAATTGDAGVLGDTEISSTDNGLGDPNADHAGSGLGDTTQQAQQAKQEWQSIRDVARSRGFDVAGQFQDDGSFLEHLLSQAQQARQSDFHARLGQQLAPHAQRIQNFLTQQSQPKAPEGPKPWEAPEFDERWLNLVERDPSSGLFIAKQGADPQYATKLNAFTQWKQGYDRNPAAVLNGMVEARAKQIAADTVREQLAIQGREQTVQSIASHNSEWLYQRDQQGQPVRDYMGQPMLTPAGARYIHHLNAIQRMGVTDPRAQDTLAKQLVQGEHYAAQHQNSQVTTTTQTNRAFNQPSINPLQAQPPAQRRQNPHATEPKATGLSLSDMLRQALAEEGTTDQDIISSVG
jgi:hypothetical protein